MPFETVNNITFHYEYYGVDNAPVVFISGYTCDINLWRPVADAIETNHKVLIFDNQGIGKTQDHGETLTVSLMAQNIAKLIQALGIDRAVVVGYAMGSSIALQLAHDFPDMVSKLILLSPVLKWSEQAKNLANRLFKLRQSGQQEAFIQLLYDCAFGSAFKSKVPLQAFTEMIEGASDVQSIEDQARQLHALELFNSHSWIKSLDVPVLVLSPDQDQFATVDDGKAVAEATLGKQVVIKDCGHAALVEQPDKLISIIKQELTH